MGFKELEERERDLAPDTDEQEQAHDQDGNLTTVFEALDIDDADIQPQPGERNAQAGNGAQAQTGNAPTGHESSGAQTADDVQKSSEQAAGAQTYQAPRRQAAGASAPNYAENGREPEPAEHEEETAPHHGRKRHWSDEEEEPIEVSEEEEGEVIYYSSVFMRVMSLLFVIASAIEIVGGVAAAFLGGSFFGNARIERFNLPASYVFGGAIALLGVLTLLAGLAGRREKKVLCIILSIIMLLGVLGTFFLDVSLLQMAVLAFYILYFGAACSIQPLEEEDGPEY